MPSPGAYRKAFGLLAGKRLCGAVVDEVRCGHTTVARFRKYDFPWSANLTLPTGLEAAAFERALRKFADDTEDTVVYSSYGSPYACSLGKVRVAIKGRVAAISATGHGVRVFSKPTHKQLVEAGKVEAHSGSPHDRALLASQGWRVIKAHFSSSHCQRCGDDILSASFIAQPPDAVRGHWEHVECAARDAAS